MNIARSGLQPYFRKGAIEIYLGDCRAILPLLPAVDVALADPPYKATSLAWDKTVDGWPDFVRANVLWCFGSFRFFLNSVSLFKNWKLAQDLVWQKQNGTSFHADRFRRIHEHVLQFYRGKWSRIYKNPIKTSDARARVVRAKGRPPHMGEIDRSRVTYVTVDGGPRLQRSIISANNCHGFALHPTQKPLELVTQLIKYSCPPGGSIIDPFLGSGTSLVSASRLGRCGIGIEKEERWCEVAAKRVQSEG